MKVDWRSIKTENPCLGDLKPGDVFTIKGGDGLYVKTASWENTPNGERRVHIVELQGGSLYFYENSLVVTPVEGVFVVEE